MISKKVAAVCVFAVIGLSVLPARGASIKPTDAGIVVDAGMMGSFTLEYPQLLGKDNKVAHKLTEKAVAGDKATLKFDGGCEVDAEVNGSNVDLTFSNLPEDVTQCSYQMRLPINLADGGKWSADDKPEQDFPHDKAAKPQLYQGHAKVMTIATGDGGHLAITSPAYGYLQLSDNRTWDWPIFMLKVSVPANAAKAQHFVLDTQAPAVVKKKIDQFGQAIDKDYPGKVKSLDELKADVESEKAYYATFHPPTFDPYGGLPDSGAKFGLSKTGFFHVEKKDPRWYLVDPDGNAFFQVSTCDFCPISYTYVTGREQIYDWIPPTDGEFATAWKEGSPGAFSFLLANEIRKYGKPIESTDWFTRSVDRARVLGFNSAGAFSAYDAKVYAEKKFPYVLSLPVNSWDHIPRITGVHETFDPFDPAVDAQYRKNCASLADRADDPQLIGYFLINEPIYEDIPKVVPTLNGKWACKRALVQMLQDKYKTIDAMNTAWGTTAAAFDELNDKGLPVTTKAASEDVQAFTGMFLEKYFQLMVDGFKQYDKNHMLLGNRLQPGTANNEQLCRICGKYVDVFSLNYYTSYLDPSFVERLYKWSGGKPMLLSEFNYVSGDDSGMAGAGVLNQEERGLAYRNYVEGAAVIPFIVGTEWYQWADQSVTGQWFSKYNGEAANTGVFSVDDRPYKPMVEQMVKTNNDIYKVMFGERPRFVYDKPKFSQPSAGSGNIGIARAAGPVAMDGSATGFPGLPPERIAGTRLVNGPDSGGMEASFKMCWDDQNLYFLSHITDSTPMQNKATAGQLWHGDGVELFVGHDDIDKSGPLLFGDRHILLGAGSPAGASFIPGSKETCKTAVVADPDGKGYTIEAAVPFSALGFVPKEGQQIRLDIAIDDSADGESRVRQLMWNGTERNSSDRTGWGRATLGH